MHQAPLQSYVAVAVEGKVVERQPYGLEKGKSVKMKSMFPMLCYRII